MLSQRKGRNDNKKERYEKEKKKYRVARQVWRRMARRVICRWIRDRGRIILSPPARHPPHQQQRCSASSYPSLLTLAPPLRRRQNKLHCHDLNIHDLSLDPRNPSSNHRRGQQKQVDAALESHRTERQAQVNRQEETLRSRDGRNRSATAEDHLGAPFEEPQYPAAAQLIPDEQATTILAPLS